MTREDVEGPFPVIVREVRNDGGSVVVDGHLAEEHGKPINEIYVEQVPGRLHVPHVGNVITVINNHRNKNIATGYLTTFEATDEKAGEYGYREAPLDTPQQFRMTKMPKGSQVIQSDRNTGIALDSNANTLKLHSGDNLEIIAGGEVKMRKDVPSGDIDGITADSRDGGTELAVMTQAELESMMNRIAEAEQQAAVALTNASAANRELDYESSDVAGSAPSSIDVGTTETVNAVDDLGWDNTGGSAIDYGDFVSGRRIEVPPGTYRVSGDNNVGSGLNNFAIVGTGGSMNDTVFTTGEGNGAVRFINSRPGSANIEVGNLTFDLDNTESGSSPCLNIDVDTGGYVHDVEYTGFTPHDNLHGDKKKCQVITHNSSGVSLLKNIVKIGPSYIAGHKNGKGMGILGQEHAGTNYYVNTHIENDNGDAPWYCSGVGINVFENCVHRNNCMAQFRVGGESVLRGCEATVDVGNAHPENQGSYADAGDLSGTGSVMGVYWAGQLGKQHGGRMENCTFNYIDRGDANGRPVSFDVSQNDTLITGCTFNHEVNTRTVIGDKGNSNYNPSPPYNIDVEDCEFHGNGNPDHVLEYNHHSNNLIKNTYITINAADSILGNGSFRTKNFTTGTV